MTEWKFLSANLKGKERNYFLDKINKLNNTNFHPAVITYYINVPLFENTCCVKRKNRSNYMTCCAYL
jgi:hypothetical protein